MLGWARRGWGWCSGSGRVGVRGVCWGFGSGLEGLDLLVGGCDEGGGGPGDRYSEGGLSAVAGDDAWYVP